MKRDFGAVTRKVAGGSWCIRSILAIVFAFSLAATGHAVAATFYVDAARPDDLGDGLSWGSAKQTIQAAISSSAAGDTILVKYGLYTIASGILIDSTRLLTSDDGTHNSWDTADPDSSLCIVTPSVAIRVFRISGATVTSAARLRGFKVAGGDAKSEATGAMYGGGIYVGDGADPVIEHCWITGNRGSTNSNGYGGGIACVNAGTSASIRYCRIDYNIASTAGSFGEGGGLFFQNTALCQVHDNEIVYNTGSTYRIGYGGGISESGAILQIWSNVISYNVGTNAAGAGGRGGGINTYGGTVEIWDNIITYNHGAEGSGQQGAGGGISHSGAGYGNSIIIRDNPAISHNTAATQGLGYGGGIYVGASYMQISGNTIDGNVASASNYAVADYRRGYGGGVYVGSGTAPLERNVIVDNTASLNGSGYGGGYYCSGFDLIRRNIFAFNTASASTSVADVGEGGGAWMYYGRLGLVANNTFYRNANVLYAGVSGTASGLYYDSAGGFPLPSFVNNIIAGNDVANSDGLGFYSKNAQAISYHCFHGNTGGNYTANVTSTNEELGDPTLADPAGGDFSLMYNSSCIEEGDPAYTVPENGAWVVDIGAIEYTGTRHWRPVTTTGLLLFGGRVKAKVNVTTLGTLSEIDMVVHPGETYPSAPTSVARWYDIDHAGTGMEFDLTLSYLESELNGRVEDSLCLWRWTGSSWDGPKNYSSRDLTQNWITVAAQTNFSDWILTDGDPLTGIDESPGRFHLSGNYPNPFNPSTTISFHLATQERVSLRIYDAQGKLVRTLVDRVFQAGPTEVVWDGQDSSGREAATGVYFVRFVVGSSQMTKKIVKIR